MKFYSFTSLAILGAHVSAADLSVSTDKVTASFLGASGGLKLFNIETEGYLMVQQAKIEEVTPDGSKCNGSGCLSINVAGNNDWSALDTVEVDSSDVKTTVTSTTFTVVEDGVTFNLIAHVSNAEWTETDPVPCSECAANGAGPCQNAGDSTCTDYEVIEGVATCPAEYTECTQSVELKSNELKFSMLLTGVTLKDPENNKIHYGISIKNKASDSGGDENTDGKAETGVVKFGDGEVTYPTTGVMVGGDSAERTVPVSVTTSTQGSKYLLDFTFEAPGAGETFYYDPTLSVTGSAAKIGASLGMLAVLAVAGFVGM